MFSLHVLSMAWQYVWIVCLATYCTSNKSSDSHAPKSLTVIFIIHLPFNQWVLKQLKWVCNCTFAGKKSSYKKWIDDFIIWYGKWYMDSTYIVLYLHYMFPKHFTHSYSLFWKHIRNYSCMNLRKDFPFQFKITDVSQTNVPCSWFCVVLIHDSSNSLTYYIQRLVIYHLVYSTLRPMTKAWHVWNFVRLAAWCEISYAVLQSVLYWPTGRQCPPT